MQSCYERTIRLTIHLLGASSDEFGAYDGVNFSPKSVTPRVGGVNFFGGKKNVVFSEKFPRPKFPHEKKARILPRGNFTSRFLDHLIIELKSVQQDEADPFAVLDDAYCCTYT